VQDCYQRFIYLTIRTV